MSSSSRRSISRSAMLALVLCFGCGDGDGAANDAGGSADLDASDTPHTPRDDAGHSADAEVPDEMDASTGIDGGDGDSGAHDANAPDAEDHDDAGEDAGDDAGDDAGEQAD